MALGVRFREDGLPPIGKVFWERAPDAYVPSYGRCYYALRTSANAVVSGQRALWASAARSQTKKNPPCGGFEWAFCHGSGLNLPAGDGLLCASSTPPSAGTTWRRPGPRPVVRGREPARSKAGGGVNEVVVRQDGHEGVKRSLMARAPRSAMAGCAASSHRRRRMRWGPRRRRGRRRLPSRV